MIPNVAHFVWIGDALPWLHAASIQSALRAGQFGRVVLHRQPSLSGQGLDQLRALRGLEARPIEPRALFRSSGVDPSALLALYARLRDPGARTNLLRAAILAAEGGVYLDLDTISVASFAPLREVEVFCGVRPAADEAEHSARARAFALARALRRLALQRRGPELSETVPNDAVLGSRANHPFMLSLLDSLLRVPRERQQQQGALGSELLRTVVANYRGPGLAVHPAQVFLPLDAQGGDEWLRLRPQADLERALSPDTRLVHFRASLRRARRLGRVDRAYVLQNRGRQLLSALLAPYAE